MFNPYFLVTFLYVGLAVLGALDASLTHFQIVPVLAGLRWMRVHFITLGAMTEFAFGILPLLVAARANLPRPKTRWDIWLTLNLGLLVLLIGIPMVSAVLITAGGTLIFTAVILLILQLGQMRNAQTQPSPSRKFYITGLAYLLLGILIGTGLWQGWSTWLQIKTPIEVHIHANNWGFMSLVFAGLLVDLYPSFAGRSFQWPNSINWIYWMMTIGALGLVLGPWFQSNIFAVPGLILHISATVWLVLNIAKPILSDRSAWTAGIWHIITSYIWILTPVMVAPLIILKVEGFPGAGIEQNAPQALIYGWVLQFGYAIIPLLFQRILTPEAQPKLGGNWFSLILVHIGGVLLWAGIFLHDQEGLLHGTAYALWFISLLPIVYELWQIVRSGMSKFEQADTALSLE